MTVLDEKTFSNTVFFAPDLVLYVYEWAPQKRVFAVADAGRASIATTITATA